MATLNDTKIIEYIQNNFHQYFDLELNRDLSTTETINLVIPISQLTEEDIVSDPLEAYEHFTQYEEGYDVQEILSKYDDTDLDGIQCVCTNVIDGDTIEVNIPCLDENNKTYYKKERVRLVGVNTPEGPTETHPAKNGYETSKEFMEKVCYSKEYLKKLDRLNSEVPLNEEEISYYNQVFNTKKIYIKIDSKRMYDPYNRILAVLIVDNKNINEVLLKENLAEIMYRPPSEFYPFDWGNKETKVHVYNFKNDDINILYPYFNSDMSNIVFTPQNDLNTIYKYEAYKGVFYIKLQPFSQYIRMHILPKAYDCSSSILVFRDDMLTNEHLLKTDDYFHNDVGNFINSYYIESIDENNRIKIRDRTNPNINGYQYELNDWPNTHCEFSYNISNSTKSFDKLQICAKYRYNNSTPYYNVHFMGIKDNTNINADDRCSLIDANLDDIKIPSNNISQFYYDEEKGLYIPKFVVKKAYSENIYHLNEIGKWYHKTLKYINDALYSEEGERSNIKYAFEYWTEANND